MSEQQYIIGKDGRRRKVQLVTCLYCGKEFLKLESLIKKRPLHYCNNKCCGLAIRKRVKLICHNCSKEFERKASKVSKSKSGLNFCPNECKNQALVNGCKEIMPEHYGNGKVSYRNKMKNELKCGCKGCSEKRSYMLIVHHIDGDRSNNKKDNLVVLCRNCHSEHHCSDSVFGNIYDFCSHKECCFDSKEEYFNLLSEMLYRNIVFT